MVNGFEEYTYELTKSEEKLVPLVVDAWNAKQIGETLNMSQMIKGLTNHISNKNLRDNKGKLIKINGPRMRKILHHIRAERLVKNLIATSKGYFKTDSQEELDNYIKSCYQRANAFIHIAEAMKNQ